MAGVFSDEIQFRDLTTNVNDHNIVQYRLVCIYIYIIYIIIELIAEIIFLHFVYTFRYVRIVFVRTTT